MPTPIFHITDLSNLAAIVEDGGLCCIGALRTRGSVYKSIAYDSVQDKRATTKVPCGARGLLHDYVPFYFAPRSPMLYAIHKGRLDTCPNGQRDIVYLVTTAESIWQANLSCVFTDGHGIMALTRFFDDPKDLCEIDWELMQATMWRDTDTDMDRKRRRQAEFLVHSFVPLSVFQGIGVRLQSQVATVLTIVEPAGISAVRAVPGWYY